MALPMYPRPRAPLVGRETELDRLQACLERTIGGEGGVVLISGEPGIGKTRLVEELATRATGSGAVVSWGRVDEGEGAPAYWPWIQVLGTVLAEFDRDVLAAALEGIAGVIAAIVPEAKELVTDLVPPPMLDLAGARFRLHQAVIDFLGSVTRRERLVIVLEDVHWADVASLELMRFLAGWVATVPVLLVATYRSVDAGSSAVFDDVLGALARVPRLQRVALAGLSESDVGRLMAHMVAVEPAAATVTAVHARTEGNPFFVSELARLLHSEGRLVEGFGRDAGPDVVPAGVRDVVRRRLGRLPEETREILVLGAVIGRDFDLAVLSAAAELDAAGTLGALGPAMAAGLIIEDRTTLGLFRFSHAVIRETVYRELGALGRATFHARVGAAVEGSALPGTRLAELARHFFHAAPIVGPEFGLRYLLAAAEAAQAVLAYEQAEDDLRRALGLVDLFPARAERCQRELQVQNRLVALMIVTRGYAADEVGLVCARARQLCLEIGETDDLFKVLSNLAGFHYVHGDFRVAEEFAERLLSIGRQRSNDMWLTAGHLFLGMVQFRTGRIFGARENFAIVRDLSASLELSGDVAERFCGLHPTAMGLAVSAWPAWALGDESQAHRFAEAGFQLASQIGHSHTQAYTWYLAVHLLVLAGDAASVLAASERALLFCEQRGLVVWQGWFRVFRGWALCQQGRADDGVVEMASAVAVHRASGARTNTPVLLGLLAEGEALRGNHIRALELVDEALAAKGEDRLWESDLYRRRGQLLAALGAEHLEEGEHSLRQALETAEAQGAVPFIASARTALATHERLGIPEPQRPLAGALPNLSARERELLGLLARGMTDKEIAVELVISVATVRSHLDRIRDKTGRRRRPELTRFAVDVGLAAR